jgi:small subunit ribosomal protein S6
MNLTEYETTLLVRPDVAGDAIEATLDRVREAIRSRGGKLIAINHWGKKKLAYPIAKHTRGVYVHTQYLGQGDLVAEVERNLRISDTVLRFLTVRVADDVDPATREEKAYVVPQYGLEEASAAEEAEAEGADGYHGDENFGHHHDAPAEDGHDHAHDHHDDVEGSAADAKTEDH